MLILYKTMVKLNKNLNIILINFFSVQVNEKLIKKE
jgi:hypothetical protein